MTSKGGEPSINVWRTATSFVAIETLRTTSSKAQNPTSPSKERCHTAIAGVSIMTSSARAVPESTNVPYVSHPAIV